METDELAAKQQLHEAKNCKQIDKTEVMNKGFQDFRFAGFRCFFLLFGGFLKH